MRNFLLQNFPFLENDFDALTDYELFCKMMIQVKKQGVKITEIENYIKDLNVDEEVAKQIDILIDNGTMDEIINQEVFGELNTRVETLESLVGTEMVVFGDSWSDPDVTEAVWPQYVADELRLNLHNYAHNGAGYVLPNNNLISTQVATATADTSYDKDLVKYVVLGGGINDYRLGVTMNNLRSAIISIYNSCKTLFPHAKIIYVNNFQYPYTATQSEYWYKLQYTMSTSGVNVLNQDGFFKDEFFLDNKFHLTVAGQKLYGSNVLSALSGGQIKNDGVTITFDDSKGYLYVRRSDNILNYYILFNNLISTDVYIDAVESLCWDSVFDSQFLGSVNLAYSLAGIDFEGANNRIKLSREDTDVSTICLNGSLSLNIDL